MRTITDICGFPHNFAANDTWLSIQGVLERIDDVASSLLDEADGIKGWRDYPERTRAATNDECCEFEMEIRVERTFDIRKPLPSAIARWMRSVAKQLAEAADRVAEVSDGRDRKLLQRYVAGDGSVKFDRDSGQFVERGELAEAS